MIKLAKLCHHLPACSLCLLLVACANQEPQGFDRSEAVKARINLALAYLDQQDYPKAKENIDKALNHDAGDYLPHSVLAYYYQQTGDAKQASTTYQNAIELSKSQTRDKQPRPDMLNNYGAFLCKQGEFEQAYRYFELAVNSQEPYYHQADTLENIALCAHLEKNQAKQANALAELTKLDAARAEKLSHHLK